MGVRSLDQERERCRVGVRSRDHDLRLSSGRVPFSATAQHACVKEPRVIPSSFPMTQHRNKQFLQ